MQALREYRSKFSEEHLVASPGAFEPVCVNLAKVAGEVRPVLDNVISGAVRGGNTSMAQFQVRVPDNAMAGSTLQVKAPSGETLRMTLPPTIRPGQVFICQYPVVTGTAKDVSLDIVQDLCGILSALDSAAWRIRTGDNNPWTLDEIQSTNKAVTEAAKPVCQAHSRVSAACGVRYAKQALLFAKQFGQGDLDELADVKNTVVEEMNLPSHWDLNLMQGLDLSKATTFSTRTSRTDKNLFAQVPLDEAELPKLQALFDTSFRKKYTRDRKGEKVPDGLEVVKAVRIQNAMNWAEFTTRKKEIIQNIETLRRSGLFKDITLNLKTSEFANQGDSYQLDMTANQAWLFHGTSHQGAQLITQEDFRVDVAGSNAGTLYGRGVYLAESCAKSDEYCEEKDGLRPMLVCRVSLGQVLYCDEKTPDTDSLVHQCVNGQYDSVLGDREKIHGTFREFIVYDEDQVYPEILVWYKRRYD
eukprot:gnl/TRDRNA2_/TRDRNA2_81828_c0_seq1.p1 gnl/TRDRNA2_/TRDRNA2_81828_c0~~gnl/TRDRNA2_/TRDRNA2_81828_c0_seq1.p1  ORF type:complete len:471 (+),score=72.68 gnl/TRDRNA2_/TRDRNA2_81828_c0_seq1:164-1576(+)